MKKVTCYILILLVVFSVLGCKKENPNGEVLRFYYCATEIDYSSNSGIFAIENRAISCKSDDYIKIIEEFLNGPRVNSCTSPFPGGTVLKEFTINNGYAKITLSPHMALQSNTNVIVCCACLCQTLFELPAFSTIEISIENKTITGEEMLVFKKDSFTAYDADK